MGLTLTEKIIKSHLVKGNMTKGEEIAIKIDNTLTQDSTGTMAYLQFEALGIDKVKTKRSVAYIDHNMLQSGPENADDHLYIQTVAKKHGIYFSKPGNGICHQVNLERFGVPGETLLGSDSHTPTGGGIGMLAIGAGGLDVAVAMAGGEYYINMPKVVKVNLIGKLKPFVSAKDIILEVLRRLSVKGGVGKIFEYTGEGVKALTVPERATITNMGAELGATTSIFPSDEITKDFLKAQEREEDYKYLVADEDAVYDEELEINLSDLKPLAACPHSPDNIVPVSELKNIKVNQVAIGSCTNSSYRDMLRTASILKGKTVSENVSLVIAPGSKQVLNMMANNGALTDLVMAGARILECACGPCIGMGQSPCTDAVSLRTFNRNFEGRSGTKSANVYLVSPEVAAVSALTGYITDPTELTDFEDIEMPNKFLINDNLIIEPATEGEVVDVKRGPNIKPFPKAEALKELVTGKALTKVGDNITTDHIMPSNAKLLPYRSNVPYLSNFCLTPCDEEFPEKAKENGGGIIVAGTNYGQGSSREHAALAPVYLGIKAVLAKSFARIHKANLINNGILPLVFEREEDYDSIDEMDELVIENVLNQVEIGKIDIINKTKGIKYKTLLEATERQKKMILKGGLLNLIKSSQQ
ncbi:TPA: aconitate hydratase [Clostridium botulinum]|uniref:Aconitase/isopropylmalate dehydratase family protein n=2 Tax=Clostridium botulinum TaxID=1491 RepID=C1FS90_CLOBJ|nr:aconitate hydratase [Clostridium botulinum]ACO86147.1 aconitase/isopropylmalate dehydratase family protein [Clostridium botulinum A2 str. Kyoto]APC80159.1 aconitase family protein [Clostridium botulinum]APH25004.1 aconitase family protein [Clostridium botulinum]APQ69540.1 aconitase family protein [Clostridium botulinum]AUN05608.1 aconitate hydratase [Clostridium botulinum]